MAFPSREFDALVATKVFGIELCDHYGHPKCNKCELNHSYWERITPPLYYSTDPNSDYTVLFEVRTNWDDVKQRKFAARLMEIHEQRAALSKTRKCDNMLYEPGDYSLAALVALGHL